MGSRLLEELATEAARELMRAARRAFALRSTADRLRCTVDSLLPLIHHSGDDDDDTMDPAARRQLRELEDRLRRALDLARAAAASPRWNVYRSAKLAAQMDEEDEWISKWLERQAPAHFITGMARLRSDLRRAERRIEDVAAAGVVSPAPLMSVVTAPAAKWFLEEPPAPPASCVGAGMRIGKEKVKAMLLGGDGGWGVVGIAGVGGSGKTTLAMEICRDHHVRAHFKDRIFIETVSQSPDVAALRMRLWEQISGNAVVGTYSQIPEWQLRLGPRDAASPALVVLDDVWSLPVLEELIFKLPGCKTLVVSRSTFPTVAADTYAMEQLAGEEALALFCRAAFDQDVIPGTADRKLVKQVAAECDGLPLALKVIGASLRDQPAKIWASARSRLSRGEAISESHEVKLLDRLATSVDRLPEKLRECFLDLCAFPEDKKIPLGVLIGIWMEVHDLEEDDAVAALFELSDRNLVALAKDTRSRAGDSFGGYGELTVTLHDVLRDLALHMSSRGAVGSRRRLVMPRREERLPREWERHSGTPFAARVVSVHTGEMSSQTDWPPLLLPEAEVLILTFSSASGAPYFLPPFIHSMPSLRSLVLINCGAAAAALENLATFTALAGGLRSIWFEKISLPPLPRSTTVPLRSLRKVSLVQCELSSSLRGSKTDLAATFPSLADLAIDTCIDLDELPASICQLSRMESISISNCHDLAELPGELGELQQLRSLRLYACPVLRCLPASVCRLKQLRYLDISQCVGMKRLPEELGGLASLERIDMRECSQLSCIPSSFRSLSHVVCDEDAAVLWKEVAQEQPELRVQIAEESHNLDWLAD